MDLNPFISGISALLGALFGAGITAFANLRIQKRQFQVQLDATERAFIHEREMASIEDKRKAYVSMLRSCRDARQQRDIMKTMSGVAERDARVQIQIANKQARDAYDEILLLSSSRVSQAAGQYFMNRFEEGQSELAFINEATADLSPEKMRVER